MRNIADWPFPAVPSQAIAAAKYAGAALGLFLLYKIVSRGVAGAAEDLTRGVVNAAGGVVTGAVVGAGEVVGIPPTSQDKCVEDIYAGRSWDASFSCPAAVFLRYAVGGIRPPRSGDGLSGYAPRRHNRNC